MGREAIVRRRLPFPVEVAVLVMVLAVGAYLRLSALDFAQFRLDDVTLFSVASQLAREPQILTRGLSASAAGFSNGPFQAYLLLPATLLTSDPLAAYVLVALFNVLAIFLLWAFVRGYWGPSVALLASLFYATNPWAVVFSRRLLGNDLLAPFTVLLIWSLCDLVRYGRRRDSVLPFLWLALAIQIYVGALTHLVLAAIGLLLGARRLRPPWAVGGLALFAALTAPYLLGALLPNLSKLAYPFGSGAAPAQIDFTSIVYMFHSISSEGYQAFANNAGQILDATTGLPRAVTWLEGGMLAVGLGAAIGAAVRGLGQRAPREAAPYLLALAAVLLPALLLIRHSATVYVYYLLTGFPMHFVLIAVGIAVMWGMPRKAALGLRQLHALPMLAVVAVVVLIVGTHLVLSQAFFSAIHEYWPKSDYGLPLRYSLDLAADIRQQARQQHFDRIFIGGIEDREGVVFHTLERDLPSLSFLDSSAAFVVPDSEAGKVLYVLPSLDDWVAQRFAQHFGQAKVASVDIPGYGLRYSLIAPGSAELRAGSALAPAKPYAARLGDCLELIGYDPPAAAVPGERLMLSTYWKVLCNPPEEFAFFTHLIGSGGSSWGQYDGLGFPIDRWRPGDLLVQRQGIPVTAGAPPGEYTIEAGGYFPASGRRLSVSDAQGTADRLRLGTASVLRSDAARRPVPQSPVALRFGDAIRLLGYDLDTPTPAVGDPLRLTLYWESVAKAAADYTVFTHLVGADGRPVAQADGPPAFGALGTAAWQPGDLIRDPHEMVVPADIRPGRYRLLIGLYLPPSGPRLAPLGSGPSLLGRLGNWFEQHSPYRAGARVDGDQVILTAIDVQPKR